MAAAESLQVFMAVINEEPRVEESGLVPVYLALYDRLVDDDENVREIGAEMVSKLMSKLPGHGTGLTRNHSLSVPIARDELLCFLRDHYKESWTLWTQSIQRLVPTYRISKRDAGIVDFATDIAEVNSTAEAVHELDLVRFEPVRDLLEEAMTPDTALFVQEKQNLYIDEVQEAKDWSQMLIDLKPTDLRSVRLNPWRKMQYLNDRFYDWTVDGLSVLAQTAEKKIDGPLGWTSKPEVFTIGMQVILAAKVHLYRNAGETSIEAEELCKERLRELMRVGLDNGLHGLWIMEVESILMSCDSPASDVTRY